jgi:hypothetical protein
MVLYVFSFPKGNPQLKYSNFSIWSEAAKDIFISYFMALGIYSAYGSHL